MKLRPARLVPAPYLPVLRAAPFRRLLMGSFLSSVGDGMSAVAIVWLALDKAAPFGKGFAVAAAAAAYSMPGILLGLTFGRGSRQGDSRRQILLDSGNRFVFLATIPVLAWAGHLTLGVYVILLAGSSLLFARGNAGRRTIIAELIEPRYRMAANSLYGSQDTVGRLIGPALAGILIDRFGAAFVIGLDALSFGVLFLIMLTVAVPRHEGLTPEDPGVRLSALRRLIAYRRVALLLILTFVFYLLYGPLEVALPIHVQENLMRDASFLGLLWTVFALGGLVGGLIGGSLRRLPLMPAALFIVLGWGATVVLLGEARQPAVVLVAMFLGGFVFAPYPAITATIVQADTRPRDLLAVNAAWSSLLLGASPLGVVLGGPLVAAVGAQDALVLSGAATMVLALVWALPSLRAASRRDRASSPSVESSAVKDPIMGERFTDR